MLSTVMLLILLSWAVSGPLLLPAGWILFTRAGLSPWLSLVLLIPAAGFLIASAILAARSWRPNAGLRSA